MPHNDDKALSKEEEEAVIVSRLTVRFKQSADHLSDWRTEAKTLFDFKAGWQWTEEDELLMGQRPTVTFNHFDPYIDAVIGFEINNRETIQYMPRELGDGGVNELLTGAADWVRELCQAEDEENDMFTDMLVTGMGWTQTFVDFAEDQDGKVCEERRDPLRMFYDPNAKKKNISDRKWQIYIADMTFNEVQETWPDKADVIRGAKAIWDNELDRTEHEPLKEHKPDNYLLGNDRIPEPGDIVRVAHYQWAEMLAVMAVQSLDGKVTRYSMKEWKRIQSAITASYTDEGLDVENFIVKQQKKVVRQAFVIGDTLLEEGPSAIAGQFTYNAITGKRDKKKNVWYALGRAMLQPQKWYNKFYSTILEIIIKNSKGGIMAEIDAFEDFDKANEEWASPDNIILLQSGALAKGKVQPKPPVEYPQGLDRLMQIAQESFRDVTNISLEMLGLTDRNQPGVVETGRKESSLTSMAWAFDALRRYRKESGKLLAHFIVKYISDGRLVRIYGERGAKFVPLLKDKLTLEFDIVVDESPAAPNVKQRTWEVLREILPIAIQMGLPIPPSFVDFMPVPGQFAEDWKNQMLGPEPTEEDIQKQNEEEARRIRREDLLDKLLDAQADQANADVQETAADTVLKTEKAKTDAAEREGTAAGVQIDARKAQAEIVSQIIQPRGNT